MHFFVAVVLLVDAYRHGDTVGILIKTHTPSSKTSRTLEAYRHQLPRFGISTVAHVNIMDLLKADEEFIALSKNGQHPPQRDKVVVPRERHNNVQPEHLRFSLSFDGGFHHIPWMDVYNPHSGDGKALSNLVITIVYSSSDGSIHGVHHQEAIYQDGIDTNTMPKSFNIEYIWVNEADVDVQGGFLVLFGTVVVASLYMMVGVFKSSSTVDDDDDDDDDNKGGGGSMEKMMTRRCKGKGISLSLLHGGGDFGSPRDVGFEKSL